MDVHVLVDYECNEVVGVYEDAEDAEKACDDYEKKKGYRPALLSTEVCPKCSL